MKDGGPAFPELVTEYNIAVDAREPKSIGGMSLRDYFAACAIQCFPLSERNVDELLGGLHPMHGVVAKFCYDLADAMLEQRIK